MTKDSLYSWTPEQREEFEKTQEEVNERLRHYYRYSNFIENTAETFSIKRKLLMSIIENGIKNGKINETVRMTSRIKSDKSAYDNKMMNKNLDDIFACTILTKTQEELDYVYSQIEQNKNTRIVREKKLNKAKFVAEHIYLLMGRDPNIIECRLQTVEEFEKSYLHALYKENGDDDLTEEQIKTIEESKQRLYNSGSAEIYSEIPLKWDAYYNAETGKMYERQLSTNEILKELYPFLKLKEEYVEK